MRRRTGEGSDSVFEEALKKAYQGTQDMKGKEACRLTFLYCDESNFGTPRHEDGATLMGVWDDLVSRETHRRNVVIADNRGGMSHLLRGGQKAERFLEKNVPHFKLDHPDRKQMVTSTGAGQFQFSDGGKLRCFLTMIEKIHELMSEIDPETGRRKYSDVIPEQSVEDLLIPFVIFQRNGLDLEDDVRQIHDYFNQMGYFATEMNLKVREYFQDLTDVFGKRKHDNPRRILRFFSKVAPVDAAEIGKAPFLPPSVDVTESALADPEKSLASLRDKFSRVNERSPGKRRLAELVMALSDGMPSGGLRRGFDEFLRKCPGTESLPQETLAIRRALAHQVARLPSRAGPATSPLPWRQFGYLWALAGYPREELDPFLNALFSSSMVPAEAEAGWTSGNQERSVLKPSYTQSVKWAIGSGNCTALHLSALLTDDGTPVGLARREEARTFLTARISYTKETTARDVVVLNRSKMPGESADSVRDRFLKDYAGIDGAEGFFRRAFFVVLDEDRFPPEKVLESLPPEERKVHLNLFTPSLDSILFDPRADNGGWSLFEMLNDGRCVDVLGLWAAIVKTARVAGAGQ